MEKLSQGLSSRAEPESNPRTRVEDLTSGQLTAGLPVRGVDLTGLGLTRTQATVYLALVDYGPAVVEDLSRRAAVDPDVVVDIMARLVAMGFVVVDGESPRRFRCIPPDIAIARAAVEAERRIVEARSAAADLTRRYGNAQVPGAQTRVQVLTGGYDVLSRHGEQFLASTREELRTMQLPIPEPAVPSHDVTADRVSENMLNLLERGVRIRALYAADQIDDVTELRDCLRPYHDAGAIFRVASGLPSRLFLYDDALASVTMTDAHHVQGMCVVRPSPVLASLQSLFDHLWMRSVPLFQGAVTDDERSRLIAGLRSGATDHAICRLLGWSRSTFQRRLRDLFDEYDVATRFQLGIRIAQEQAMAESNP